MKHDIQILHELMFETKFETGGNFTGRRSVDRNLEILVYWLLMEFYLCVLCIFLFIVDFLLLFLEIFNSICMTKAH